MSKKMRQGWGGGEMRPRGGGLAGSQERDRFKVTGSQTFGALRRSRATGLQMFLSRGILASNKIPVETPGDID